MKPTRRDLLFLGAGAAVATPFTPLPWKLLDDVAIWTQNGSFVAKTPRGEPSVAYTSCTLCPAACGMKARCVNGKPVGIAPVADHPVSRGALCALAFGAHQLPWHALRNTKPLLNGQPATMDAILQAVSAKLQPTAGGMAILDARPGRSVSRLYRKFAAEHRGLYLTSSQPGSTASRLLAAWSGAPEPLGIDLDNTRLILSFGTPVLQGWGTPGRVLGAWKQRKFRLTQVESNISPTAALADRWLKINPGTEAHLAEALAGRLTAEEAAKTTGIPAAAIRQTADELTSSGPAIVLADDPHAVALNTLCGSVGRPGGFLGRRPTPSPSGEPSIPASSLDDAPDASISLLFIDGEAAPWQCIEKKLKPGAVVVVFSAYRAGLADHANCVVPTPAFLESLDDVPTPFDATAASYSLARPLLTPPAGTITPHAFLAKLAGWPEDAHQQAVDAQIAAIHAAKRGTVFTPSDGASTPVTAFEAPAKLTEKLMEGACWQDDPAAPQPLRCSVPATLSQPASGAQPAWSAAVLPPLATKIYQESNIRKMREA